MIGFITIIGMYFLVLVLGNVLIVISFNNLGIHMGLGYLLSFLYGFFLGRHMMDTLMEHVSKSPQDDLG